MYSKSKLRTSRVRWLTVIDGVVNLQSFTQLMSTLSVSSMQRDSRPALPAPENLDAGGAGSNRSGPRPVIRGSLTSQGSIRKYHSVASERQVRRLSMIGPSSRALRVPEEKDVVNPPLVLGVKKLRTMVTPSFTIKAKIPYFHGPWGPFMNTNIGHEEQSALWKLLFATIVIIVVSGLAAR